VGAVNIRACQIPTKNGPKNEEPNLRPDRYPANLLIDEEGARVLSEQSKETIGTKPENRTIRDRGGRMTYNGYSGEYIRIGGKGDSGTAARYFNQFDFELELTEPPICYCHKATRDERDLGCIGKIEPSTHYGDYGDGLGETPKEKGRRPFLAYNVHTTVKPIKLMRWCIKLVTRPGALILDPFAGSGTTGCAAVLEERNFIGIEREENYQKIARARIEYWAGLPKPLKLFGEDDGDET
jgi:site-specific DNA-methyltransferase (adenine-specific)